MSCDHPREKWVGKADGIYCGQCGAKIEPSRPAPKAEEKAPEPVKAEPKKAASKKGGKK